MHGFLKWILVIVLLPFPFIYYFMATLDTLNSITLLRRFNICYYEVHIPSSLPLLSNSANILNEVQLNTSSLFIHSKTGILLQCNMILAQT